MDIGEYVNINEAMTEILAAQGITDTPTPAALAALQEWLSEAYNAGWDEGHHS